MELTKSSIQPKTLRLVKNLKGFKYLNRHEKAVIKAIAALDDSDKYLTELDIEVGVFRPSAFPLLEDVVIYRIMTGITVKELKEALFPREKNYDESKKN